jgi:hypothetical protein
MLLCILCGFSFEHISHPLAFTVTGASYNQHEHDFSSSTTAIHGHTRSLTYTYLSWTQTQHPQATTNHILQRLRCSDWNIVVYRNSALRTAYANDRISQFSASSSAPHHNNKIDRVTLPNHIITESATRSLSMRLQRPKLTECGGIDKIDKCARQQRRE